MPWHFREPQTFPAAFFHSVRMATDREDHWIVLDRVANRREAKAIAERFRWFRWCVRNDTNAKSREFTELVDGYDWRTKVEVEGHFIILYLRARAKFSDELLALNPALAKEIFAIVNSGNY